MDNNLNSARAVAEAFEKEQREKETSQRERDFDKSISLQTLNELRSQNALLKKEYEESQTELKKSKRYNLIMLIVTLISTAVAIASMIIAIVQ